MTGNQGGAVAQALQGTGFHLRGLTRVPEGEQAAAARREAGVKHSVSRASPLAFAREGALVVGCDLEVEAAQSTVEAVRAAACLNALSALFDDAAYGEAKRINPAVLLNE